MFGVLILCLDFGSTIACFFVNCGLEFCGLWGSHNWCFVGLLFGLAFWTAGFSGYFVGISGYFGLLVFPA